MTPTTEADLAIQQGTSLTEPSEPSFELDGMIFTMENISPGRARKYLERNIVTNRPVSDQLIGRYSRDMGANSWITTHEAVAFDTEGNLIDGQQRLWAIIKSGKTIRILVVRNVQSTAFIVINTGRSRSPQDSLRMSGMEGVNRRKLSIARRVILGLNTKNITFTPTELKSILDEHSRAIDFAYDVMTNDYNVAPIGAAVARAYYSQPRDRLKEFGQILSAGFGPDGGLKPGDQAAIQLKAFVDKNRQDSKTDRKQAEIYAKTEYALAHFVKSVVPQNLRKVDDELFALPGEKIAA